MNASENKANPTEEDSRSYIGLEHLDSGSLHVKRWGSDADLKGQKLRMKKGDLLFAKRNAYLRRVAIAPHDGFFSAHGMVLRPRGKHILPEFLPFFLQSDMFMERAIEISVGSLSPTINWKTLKVQEFPLPPLDEQKHIAEILWAADEAVEKWHSCQSSLQRLIESIVEETGKKCSSQRLGFQDLGDVATVERGKFSHRPRNLPQFYGGPYPFAQTGDVHRANGFIRNFEYTLTNEGKQYSKSFPTGTILITIAAVIGATAITEAETWATDSVVGIVPGDEMNVYFLEYFLRTQRHYLENVAATQTAQKNINLQILRPLQVPVPPLQFKIQLLRKSLGYKLK